MRIRIRMMVRVRIKVRMRMSLRLRGELVTGWWIVRWALALPLAALRKHVSAT